MQLLQYSYDHDRYATQFVFVSDTSIPLVSFNEMYQRLTYGINNNNNNDNNSRSKDEDDDEHDEDHHIDNHDYENMTQKSRLCLTTNHEQAEVAWLYPAGVLNISLNDVKKGEMWTIPIRQHVHIILNERSTLDTWNQIFYKESDHFKKRVGAPDENLFPTLLHLKSL